MILQDQPPIVAFYCGEPEDFLSKFREAKDSLIFLEELVLQDNSKQINLLKLLPIYKTEKIKDGLWYFNAHLMTLWIDFDVRTRRVEGEIIHLLSLCKVVYNPENCCAKVTDISVSMFAAREAPNQISQWITGIFLFFKKALDTWELNHLNYRERKSWNYSAFFSFEQHTFPSAFFSQHFLQKRVWRANLPDPLTVSTTASPQRTASSSILSQSHPFAFIAPSIIIARIGAAKETKSPRISNTPSTTSPSPSAKSHWAGSKNVSPRLWKAPPTNPAIPSFALMSFGNPCIIRIVPTIIRIKRIALHFLCFILYNNKK